MHPALWNSSFGKVDEGWWNVVNIFTKIIHLKANIKMKNEYKKILLYMWWWKNFKKKRVKCEQNIFRINPQYHISWKGFFFIKKKL